ncbi:MAG: hypothetical protein ACYTG3_15710 [Planctomycetota bacterium]|jgi:hypothetical protein
MTPARLASLCVLLAACAGPGRHQPVAEEEANFVLHVSNQGPRLEVVDINVRIDGRLAFEGPFDVGEEENFQHNWHTYFFRLDPGKHVLTADSGRGQVKLERTFKLPAKRWAVLNHWAPSDTEERYFSFEIRKEKPVFE